jgi:hypothetical protein
MIECSRIKNARKIYNAIGFSSIIVDIFINYSLLVGPSSGSGEEVLDLQLNVSVKL